MQTLHKGSQVGIEGRIQTRNYENQQGQKVYVTEVLAENFSLLEPRNTTSRLEGDRESFNGGHENTFNGNKNANTSGNFANNDPLQPMGMQLMFLMKICRFKRGIKHG